MKKLMPPAPVIERLRRDQRRRDLEDALRRWRAWDQAMIRKHGPTYYRTLGYPVH